MKMLDRLLDLLQTERAHLRDPAIIILSTADWNTLNDEVKPLTGSLGLEPGLAQAGFHGCSLYGVPVTHRPDVTTPIVISTRELEKGAAAR